MTIVGPERASGSALDEPHHDGSELCVVERPDALGGKAVIRMRAPRRAAERAMLRYVVDGEPRSVPAVVDEQSEDETWWRAELPMGNPVVRYRWLLAAIPVVILFMSLQKFIIGGLTQGSVKG